MITPSRAPRQVPDHLRIAGRGWRWLGGGQRYRRRGLPLRVAINDALCVTAEDIAGAERESRSYWGGGQPGES